MCGGFCCEVSIEDEPVEKHSVEEVVKRWEVRTMQGAAFRLGMQNLSQEREEAVQERFLVELQGMQTGDGVLEERVRCMYVRGWKPSG